MDQRDKKLLYVLILWLLLALIMEPLFVAYIIKHLNTNPTNINDLLFNILPYLPDLYIYYGTPMLFLSIITTLYAIYKDPKFSYNILLTFGTVIHFRNFSILLTNLPLTQYDIDDGRCIEYSKLNYGQILKHTFLGFECSDYFFSGHMTFYTIGLLSVSRFVNKRIYKIIIILYITCMLSLISARVHYSIDVIHSIYITYTTYAYMTPNIIKYLINKLDSDNINPVQENLISL